MGVVSAIIGIFAGGLYLISLLPFMAWINIIVIPMAAVGLAMGLTGRAGVTKSFAIFGAVFNALIAILGLVRLF